MKYRKAWKICAKCNRTYITVEYSMYCPRCRKIESEELGINYTTARNYEKYLWGNDRDTFEWTLIGIFDEKLNMYITKCIYDCWPENLKDILMKEGRKWVDRVDEVTG